jgi:hypothetical protein
VIDRRSTLEDVCFEVAHALASAGIKAVLTGGSAATVYSRGAYTSLDIDFVLMTDETRETIGMALGTLGFAPSRTRGMYHHPNSKYTVDFPRGPLAVGGDYIRDVAVLERDKTQLSILTRTDCVRDRLAHFYFWNDYTALRAAVAVAKDHDVGVEALRQWTERESSLVDYRPKFGEFLQCLRDLA